jgi:hypothetical protein
MQPNPRNNLTEMYPGIYQPSHAEDGHDGPPGSTLTTRKSLIRNESR